MSEDTIVGLVFVLLFFGGGGTLLAIGKSLVTWVDGRVERLAAEQEHRHKLERDRLRSEQKIAAAEKLRDVMSIALADKALAGELRAEIDKVYPQVRVETDEEEDDDRRDRRKKRSR